MSVSPIDMLKAEIDELIPDLVATRRDLHEHPELAFEEVRTSSIVTQRLQALGLEVQTGIAKTGVVGLLRGEAAPANARTIAIRADIDALPIHELNEVDYRSQTDGKMHACGHDGHTAIALAVADILTKRRAELTGNVKFIFQPAEERIGGAKPMVDEGTMQGVDAVIGLHLISNMPIGKVGVRSGTVFASADTLNFTVNGKGGHAAMPESAIDPIVISAHIITALQTLISRETSPFSPAVITIGTLKAGTASNIIPEYAIMEGTMRSYSKEHRDYLLKRISELSQGIASAMGGSCEVTPNQGCPPCTNNPEITKIVRQAAIGAVGSENVDESEAILISGSDDMAHFLDAVPGCYFIVGSGNVQKGSDFPHHHPRFNLDEDALPVGVEVLTRSVFEFFES
ncbi:M20 metallopeptidase family protein [Ktedonobacter racemifer]|uniref:Amidohydrolase n=1 Tax=Ktedonobacter racemifer DSM 44963 TaxID=485913 RepID=D6TGM7_KTERA|nr:amidohydrolase [Ktedonobacter racemifer]EFH90739.1 amidohydrolase [Ktedonobacter racemifer DSM 44963]